jgi:uncharacterized membrane protein YhaH (DUF805 family)
VKLPRIGGLLVLLAAANMLYQVCVAFLKWDLPFPGAGEFLFGLFWRWQIVGLDQALINFPYIRLLLLLLIPIGIIGLLGKRIALPGQVLLFIMSCSLYISHLLQAVSIGELIIYPGSNGPLLESLHLLLFYGCLALLVWRIPERPQPEVSRREYLRWILFGFSGRISRKTCWVYFTLLPLALIGISLLLAQLIPTYGSSADEFFSRLTIIQIHVSVLMFWPSLALYAKRCHDRNRSGWFQLLAYIPLINFYFWVEIFCLRGTHGRNRFGLDPLLPEDAQDVAVDDVDHMTEQQQDRAELRQALSPTWNVGRGSLFLYRLGGFALLIGFFMQIYGAAKMLYYSKDAWPKVLGVIFFGPVGHQLYDSVLYLVFGLPGMGIIWLLVLPLTIMAIRGKKIWTPGLLLLLVILLPMYVGHLCGLMKWGEVILTQEIRFLAQLLLPEGLFMIQTLGLVLILGNFTAAKHANDSLGRSDRLRWLLFSIEGRVIRLQHCLGLLTLFVLLFVGSLTVALFFSQNAGLRSGMYSEGFAIAVLAAHLLLFVLWPLIALRTKRCHDRNRSGWYQLISLIPLVNIYYSIEMLFFKGTDGMNRFGEDPQIQKVCEEFLVERK